MEPSTRTGDVEGASVRAGAPAESAQDAPTARLDMPTAQHDLPAAQHDVPTAQHDVAGPAGAPPAQTPPASDMPASEVRPSVLGSMHEQCSACGAAMAPDQRYCLECGERNGPARVPALDSTRQRRDEAPAGRSPHRPPTSVNTALIAGVGTLLLALGVGVLIGRSSNGSSAKTPAAQVITVPAGGGSGSGAAGTGTTGAGTSTSPTAQTPGAAASKASKSGAAATTSKVVVKKASGPPPKVVHVGSPGKGPGYQKGHFTGNFFGGEEPEEK